jgi:hypothetical protein
LFYSIVAGEAVKPLLALLKRNDKRLLRSNGYLSRKEKVMEGQGSAYASKKHQPSNFYPSSQELALQFQAAQGLGVLQPFKPGP